MAKNDMRIKEQSMRDLNQAEPQTDEQWAQDIIDQIEAAKGIPSSE